MAATAPARDRLLTIGTVCRRLKPEFADISISKIRYLEDQGLLTPKRTQGGYRLFGEDDVERLETILRLQRDEFLPLRVIREELAAGAGKERRKRRTSTLGEHEDGVDLEGLCERAGIAPARAGSSRSTACSSPASRAGSASTRRPTPTSRRRARRSPASESLRVTCAPSARPPTVRRGCSRRSSRPPSAPGTPSAAVPGSKTSRRWPSRRTSSRSFSSRATSVNSPVSERVTAIDLKTRVREVPDFPEPGIGFKDITPLLLDPAALRQAVDDLAGWTAEREPDLVLGAEARGFLLGGAIACRVGCGFVPARRPGKLPPETVTARYFLDMRAAFGENTAIKWVRVHDVPDYVYFNHEAHVNATVGCETCHGRVDQMAAIGKVAPLTMGWCLDCHREPGPNLRPRDRVTEIDDLRIIGNGDITAGRSDDVAFDDDDSVRKESLRFTVEKTGGL